jgi:hypothetical protein
MRYTTFVFGLEGPLHLEIILEPIKECGSRNLLAQVFGERWLLFVPRIRTELHIVRDLIESYPQAHLLKGVTALGVQWEVEVEVEVVVWGRRHLSGSRLRVAEANEVA